MASKYAGLKGKIPQQESERTENLNAEISARHGRTIAELTAEYNRLDELADDIGAFVKWLALKRDACEILIRKKLDGDDADAVRINGYTWSETFEPYPIAEDPAAIVKYYKENGLEDQLALKSTELASRLKNHVKEEALANELVVEVKEVDDPTAPGGKREITEVRSRIPGVRVFLKAGLSRVKSKGAKA